MEKHSAAYAARKQRMIDAFYTTRIQKLYSTKSDIILLFGVSAKSKKEKPKTLRSL
jgi:hypothetical protein